MPSVGMERDDNNIIKMEEYNWMRWLIRKHLYKIKCIMAGSFVL